MTDTKVFRTFNRIYSLFKSERLSTIITLKARIIQLLTYACPAWELAADTYLLKLQRLQYQVLRTTGNFPSFTPVRDWYTAFNLHCVYDYVQETRTSHIKS
jgi:hypothetical protein